jgi:beta-lactamase regulating signal transducer with metallopeptidase domain
MKLRTMKKFVIKKKFLAWLLFFGFFIILFFAQSQFGQETKPAGQDIALEPEKAPEKITSSPANIREAVGIYVFLAWIWLSIIVLVYFLRLKIKEVDRLHRLGYFSGEKK